jgi:hypothetical protein
MLPTLALPSGTHVALALGAYVISIRAVASARDARRSSCSSRASTARGTCALEHWLFGPRSPESQIRKQNSKM